MIPSHLLTKYNAWTNKLIFEATSALPSEETTKEHENCFGSIVRVLHHNYIVNLIWQAHLEEREHGFTNRHPKEHPPLEKLWSLQQKLDQWFIAYFDGLSIEKLNEPVNFKLISGTCGTMTREEILLHIVNHTTYHRGFIANMFYKISVQPPVTDLPIFLMEHRKFNEEAQ